MSVLLHRRVESLMEEADAAQRSGHKEEADRLYLEAATLEEAAFRSIPVDRVQTRAVIAISAVALYCDAGAFDAAERFGHELLGLQEHPLSNEAQKEVNDLIVEVRRRCSTSERASDNHITEDVSRGARR